MNRIAVHAGHNPDGMIACGAVGYIKESTCAREIVSHLKGGAFIDVTVNDGASQNDVLKRVTDATNVLDADCAISIHLNSYSGESANGVEAWVYYAYSDIADKARDVLVRMAKDMGYKNRGVKVSKSLYVLSHIKVPTVIFECGFVTNKEDSGRFDAKKIADIIADVFTGSHAAIAEPENNMVYKVQVGAFNDLSNAQALREKLKNIGYSDAYIKKESK